MELAESDPFGLLSDSGRWSMPLVERLRGARLASCLSSSSSDVASGHGSETGRGTYRLLSVNLKETNRNGNLKKVPS